MYKELGFTKQAVKIPGFIKDVAKGYTAGKGRSVFTDIGETLGKAVDYAVKTYCMNLDLPQKVNKCVLIGRHRDVQTV